MYEGRHRTGTKLHSTPTPAPTMKYVKYSKQLQIYGRQHTRPGSALVLPDPPLPHPQAPPRPPGWQSGQLVIQLKCKDFSASGTTNGACRPQPERHTASEREQEIESNILSLSAMSTSHCQWAPKCCSCSTYSIVKCCMCIKYEQS